MEFKFGNKARFTPIKVGGRIEYHFDRKDLCVRSHTVSTGKNKKIKDAKITPVSHGLYKIEFTTANKDFSVEVYRGKLVHGSLIEDEAAVKEVVKKEVVNIEEVIEHVDDEFVFNLNINTVDFTRHFLDRIKERGAELFSEEELGHSALFENAAKAWALKAMIHSTPLDYVLANKIVYVHNERVKVWTQTILVGKFSMIIETWPERSKLVSFIDRSKITLNKGGM